MPPPPHEQKTKTVNFVMPKLKVPQMTIEVSEYLAGRRRKLKTGMSFEDTAVGNADSMVAVAVQAPLACSLASSNSSWSR